MKYLLWISVKYFLKFHNILQANIFYKQTKETELLLENAQHRLFSSWKTVLNFCYLDYRKCLQFFRIAFFSPIGWYADHLFVQLIFSLSQSELHSVYCMASNLILLYLHLDTFNMPRSFRPIIKSSLRAKGFNLL